MRLRYGGYQWNVNGTTLTHQQETLWDARERPYSTVHTFDVRGTLEGGSQADITTAIQTMANALKQPYQDFVLAQDSGANSYHALRNADTISGVRVVRGPSFREATGAEYATIRTFEFTVSGEIPITSAQFNVLEFEEELSFSGGGPLYVVLPALYGPPQKQMVFEQLPYSCVQRGHAVGYRRRPEPPAPLFPLDLVKSPNTGKKSPHYRGRGTEKFAISWEYEFRSPYPLVAEPTVWLS